LPAHFHSPTEEILNLRHVPYSKFDVGEFLSTDDLPAPKKLPAKEAKEELQATRPAPKREVGIADQIAIRSYVLGKSIGKTGGSE